MIPPTNPERRAFLKALHARVGDHNADAKTTILDFVGTDLALTTAQTDRLVEVLVKAGLVTPPTRERVIGLTDLGLAVARRREQEEDEDWADDWADDWDAAG